MRLGRVFINFSYVVDLDDQDMVHHAIESIHEDIMSYVKRDENPDEAVNIEEDPSLSEGDIPEFLREDIDNG